MTWYQIIWLICIDLSLICIDITALTQLTTCSQLFIVTIETLILSLVSIFLGSYELWKIKEVLAYTEEKKKKKRVRNADSDSSSEDLDKKFDKQKM